MDVSVTAGCRTMGVGCRSWHKSRSISQPTARCCMPALPYLGSFPRMASVGDMPACQLPQNTMSSHETAVSVSCLVPGSSHAVARQSINLVYWLTESCFTSLLKTVNIILWDAASATDGECVINDDVCLSRLEVKGGHQLVEPMLRQRQHRVFSVRVQFRCITMSMLLADLRRHHCLLSTDRLSSINR